MSLRILVAGLMLVTALVLGAIAYQITTPAHVVTAAHTPAPAPLLVGFLTAAHALPAGTLARDEDFTVKKVPAGQVPPDSIPDTPEVRASLRGALIRNYLDAGVTITTDDILRPRDRGFLASVLAPGTRAISVGVDPVSGVSGLIWPGDYVDVILTQKMAKASEAHRILSETILKNIRVIGIDQKIVQGAPANASAAGHLARTVTLQVTPAQAEKLTVARDLGTLDLTIRSASDHPDPAFASASTMYGADVSPALSRTHETSGVTVQVIEGDKRKEVQFR